MEVDTYLVNVKGRLEGLMDCRKKIKYECDSLALQCLGNSSRLI